MKHIIIVLLLVLLITSCAAVQKVPEPVAQRPRAQRINIANDQGFLEGFLVFGDSLYFAGHAPEAAKEFYKAMVPSESVIPFIDELFKVHNAREEGE